MPLILAGLSALLYGVADFAGGLASSRNPVLPVVVASQAAGLVLALVAIAAMGTPFPARTDLAWGVAAGLSGAFGVATLYGGIASGIVAIVSPVSALVGAVLPAAFGLLIGERLSALALAGAALCMPAIVLLSLGGSSGERRGSVGASLLKGLLAGLGFAGFFVFSSRTSSGSGLWPLAAARCASIAALLSIAAATSRRLAVAAPARPWTVGSGLADMGANILFLLAARAGSLVLASVVTSIYPLPTVVFGALAFKERVPPVRIAGIALALAGVALISLK
jgi:drug/metabolite transporter (DMT)-like permease